MHLSSGDTRTIGSRESASLISLLRQSHSVHGARDSTVPTGSLASSRDLSRDRLRADSIRVLIGLRNVNEAVALIALIDR